MLNVAILEKLKEYKEILTLIVFFLGGIFWLNEQFPKKADLTAQTTEVKNQLKKEVSQLRCQLKEYMILTQLQIKAQNLEKEYKELSSQNNVLSSVNADQVTSPAAKKDLFDQITKVKAHLPEVEQDIKSNKHDMEKVSNELQTNICGEFKETT
jgi:galactitol-specific phosphotransferase system IIB component